jgi:hypothetical protein
MKTNSKITFPVLIIAVSSIIILCSIQSNQANSNHGKTAFLLTGGNIRSAQEQSKYQYVGAEKCASVCHNNDTMGYQLNSWNSSPHREAYKILISKKAEKYMKKAHLTGNPQESAACLKCHITGAGLDSSSFASTYKKEDGVTCEACHKGEFIKKAFIPKETDCLKCHNNSVHKIDKFNFTDRCAKIAHPRPKAKPML